MKENEASFEIFENNLVAKMEPSKWNNYSAKTQPTWYSTTVLRKVLFFFCVFWSSLGLPNHASPCHALGMVGKPSMSTGAPRWFGKCL